MADLTGLLVCAFAVGAFIGAAGVGGMLLIPALTAFAGLPVRVAMATALCSFIFTGIAGTVMFQRRGTIDWTMTRPVIASAALTAIVGGWVNSRVAGGVLMLILAIIMVFAGVYALAAYRGRLHPAVAGRSSLQNLLLASVGAVAGFGAGLAGVGGPALAVPLMLLCGFPVLSTVGTGQVLQIVAATSGTIGNLVYGAIAFDLALKIALVETAGVVLGARIAHSVNANRLRIFVATLCIVTGIGLLVRELGRLN